MPRMWFLFHHGAKTRAVPGGETFTQTCPECGKRAQFIEVELTESVGVFFVDVVEDASRAFRCGACGETFTHKDDGGDERAREPAKKSATELAEERRAAEAERRAASEQKALRIEDELAELKKRMGR
jgi:rubredoxin